ncbi:UNVERIFIED_CONTAM: hypothetical protein Slati_3824900 [Sesamum latifolium]|uniref:Uncharacterized protein n=1 Tax=Sesamum latifolium TaxID=2727402 RepID=A0AAW2TJY1_9LAMI
MSGGHLAELEVRLTGNSQESLIENLRSYRVGLCRWNKEEFGNIQKQCRELENQICSLEQGQLITTSNRILSSMRTRLEDLSYKEELMWKQRAKALWLKEGDKNTAFFHAKANERRLRKEVKALRDASGMLVTRATAIKCIIHSCFADIFHSIRPPEAVIRGVVEQWRFE